MVVFVCGAGDRKLGDFVQAAQAEGWGAGGRDWGQEQAQPHNCEETRHGSAWVHGAD